MAIHDRIKKIRSEFFKSNLDFATKLGEKPNTTSNWISGTRKIGLEVVEKIASKLPNINIDWLITGQGEMLKQDTKAKEGINVNNVGSGIIGNAGTMTMGNVHPYPNNVVGCDIIADNGGVKDDKDQKILLLENEVKHLNELLAEKERIIQVLLKNS